MDRARLGFAMAAVLCVGLLGPIVIGSALVHRSGIRRPSWERQASAFSREIAGLGYARTVLIIGVLGGTPPAAMIALALQVHASDLGLRFLAPDAGALLATMVLVWGLLRGHIAWRLAWAFGHAHRP
jgi:hypothetical protein